MGRKREVATNSGLHLSCPHMLADRSQPFPGEMAVAAFPVAADPRPGHRFFVVAWSMFRTISGFALDRMWFQTVTDAPVWSAVVSAKTLLFVTAVVISAIVLGSSVVLSLRADGLRQLRPLFDGGSLPGQDGACPPLADVRTGGLPGAADRVDRHGPMAVVAAVPSRRVAGDTGPGAGRGSRFLPVSAPALGGGQRLAAPTGNRRDRLRYLRVSRRRETPLSGAGRSSSKRAVAHLAVLGAALAVLQGLHYALIHRPTFALDRSGAFDGAGYTDLTVGVPVTWLLAAVALAAAVAVVRSAVKGRWRLSLAVLVAWGVLHLVGLVVLPTVFERYVVLPDEAAYELPNFGHNLDATRSAYGLTVVEVATAPILDGLTGSLDIATAEDLTEGAALRHRPAGRHSPGAPGDASDPHH